MTVEPDDAALEIRSGLVRKSLADATLRGAIARLLGVTESEILAMLHLARSGELTPGQLGSLLQLSSGGTTGLINRLERGGHVIRRADPRDRRSALVRLTASTEARAGEAWAPLVAEIDAATRELSGPEREAVTRFLDRASDAVERRVARMSREADAVAHDALVVPLPALWA
jgi:DNA-binding MarR family transcriptional regulator